MSKRYQKKSNYNAKDRKSNDTVKFERRETPPVSNPEEQKLSRKSQLLAVTSFKGLRDRGLIEVKADPYSSPMRAGYPIPAIGTSSPVVDVKYSGSNNISGNILVEMMDSDDSKMLNVIDGATATARLRYLYLTYEQDDTTGENKVNLGLNKQMLNSFFQAISDLEATQTTDLALFTSEFESSMPSVASTSLEQSQAEGIMQALLHYQTVLQNISHPISKYVQSISLSKYAQDMTYNRESAFINSLFAQLKKTAYRSTINSLGDALSSEYFDVSWKKQMNVLSSFSSRRSNSLDSALKTMVVTTRIPSLKRKITVGQTDTIVYDSDDELKATGIFFNPDTLTDEGTVDAPLTLNLEQLVYRFCKLIDVNTMISYSRRKGQGTLPINALNLSSSGYYQRSINLLNAIQDIAVRFKTKMSFIRSALKKLTFSNLVYWTNNNFILAENISDAKIIYNALVEDIFAAALGGCASMQYDDNTKRWKSYTLWDKYTGVPGYDDMSGGAFLTFSLRQLPAFMLRDDTSLSKIPLLFDTLLTGDVSFECTCYNRFGFPFIVDYDISEDLGSEVPFARLDVLNENFPVKIPKVIIPGTIAQNRSVGSAALKFIQDCCGYGTVQFTDGKISGCRDSLVCFVDFQVEDITNEMISFCRNYSPFRISTPDGRRTIGFASMLQV